MLGSIVLISTVGSGCSGGEPPEGGSGLDTLSYILAFDALCSAASFCYGPGESSRCEYYVSTVRFGFYPALDGNIVERECLEALYAEDPDAVDAFLSCHTENERRATECVRTCPTDTSLCHRGRHNGLVACRDSVTPDILMRIAECI